MAQTTLDELGAKIEAARAKHGIGREPQVGGPAPRAHHVEAIAAPFDLTLIGVMGVGLLVAGALFAILSQSAQSVQTSAVWDALNNQTTCLRAGGELLPNGQARYLLCRGADGLLLEVSPLTEGEAMAAVRRVGAERMLAQAQLERDIGRAQERLARAISADALPIAPAAASAAPRAK